MKRLTKRDRQGNWCIKGLPWKDIHIGQVITENTHEKTYGAFRKLLDYEEIGLTPEKVQLLKERDMSKKLDTRSSCEEHTHFKCPTCGKILMTEYIGYRKIGGMTNFCPNCGQRLDWNEVE